MSANVDWKEAEAQLDHLEKDCSTEGWDSYGGHPLTPECLATARHLVTRACITPMSSGGLCFTFGGDENLLFTIGDDGRVTEMSFDQPGPRA